MNTNALERCIIAANEVDSIDAFKAWTRNHVYMVIGHQCMACGHGRVTSAGVSMDYVILIDYPVEHIQSIENAAGGIDTPLMRRWLATRRPVYFDAGAPGADVDTTWLAKFNRHDLRNAVADAVFDEQNYVGTYFSFHRLPGIDQPSFDLILRDLTPCLHTTLMRAVANLEKEQRSALHGLSQLTEKEREIAIWLGKGKSNAEIAMLESITQSTVKHHLSRIMDKTGCSNRAGVAVFATRWLASPLSLGTKVL
ncbi:helix-turn-helix transcriptional regulator [Ralstonia pseudosolanacearum]